MGAFVLRQIGQYPGAWCYLAVVIWLAIALPGKATCEFFSAPQRFNTQTDGDTIIIGAQPDRRYKVILSRYDDAALAEIRACIPDAFATRSRIGPYIQVGSFENRRDAETIRRILQKEGYPVRTSYAQ